MEPNEHHPGLTCAEAQLLIDHYRTECLTRSTRFNASIESELADLAHFADLDEAKAALAPHSEAMAPALSRLVRKLDGARAVLR